MRFFRAVIIFAGVILVAGISTYVFWYSNISSFEDQLPQSTLAVVITEPNSGVVLLLGGPYTVRAEIVGQVDVTSVELWANGNLVGISDAASIGGYGYQAKWDWSIQSPGEQILFARAYDAQGQVVVSSPILLSAVQTDLGVVMESYFAAEGQTLTDIAADTGTSLDDLLFYNDVVSDDVPLEEGKTVYVPMGSINFQSADQSGQENPLSAPEPDKTDLSPSKGIGNPYLFWLGSQLNLTDSFPQAPLLSGEAIGCSATLYIGDQADNELGFLIYRYHANSEQWVMVGEIGAYDGSDTLVYMDITGLPVDGTFYMVEAFNAQGKAASVPVMVVPIDPTGCDQVAWEGIPIVNGILALTPVYERVYLYFTAGGGQFQRVPADQGMFLPAVENGYDLKPFIEDMNSESSTAQTIVFYEVWGWQGGSLTRIGAGGAQQAQNQDLPLPLNSGKLEISGLGFFSDISPGTEEAKIRPEPWDFYWYGQNLSSVDGRVQVSLSPFPASADLNPPGLVAETDVSLGLFSIDFGEVLGYELEEESAAEELSNQTQSQGTLRIQPGTIGLYPGAVNEPGPVTQVGSQTGVQGNMDASQVHLADLAAYPLDLYIRILPFNDGKAAGPPTNTVIAHYIPPDPNAEDFEFVAPTHIEPVYQTEVVKILPPDFADPNRWGCVVVTGHDDQLLNSIGGLGNALRDDYPIGLEICPEPFTGGNTPTFESVVSDIFNGFKSLFNKVTGLYNDLKAKVIELALDILDCGEDTKELCEFAVKAAVDYGLAAVGLPPSLPDFDQFAEAAKGEMVDVMVEEAVNQSPVPCPDPCQEELRKAIESSVDTMIDEMSKEPVAPGCVSVAEAHAHGSEPWCPPPGIIVKPAPGAANQPASAVIAVSLLPEVEIPPDYPDCQIVAGIQVSKYFEAQTWIGAGGWLKYPIDAQTVVMRPYYTENFVVSGLAPGETAEFTVVFRNLIPYYYLPWTSDMYKQSQIAPNWKQDWYTAVRGGTAVLSTSGVPPYSQGSFYTETSSCAISDQVQFTMP